MRVTKSIQALLAVFLIGLFGSASADGGGGNYSNSPLNPIYELLDDKKYSQALSELNAIEEKDADVFNLIGFSNRKLKNYAEALLYYHKALELEPEHKGANEYLGELYLETGKLDLAKERLAVLDDACFFPCSEYKTLKRAIEKYEAENPS